MANAPHTMVPGAGAAANPTPAIELHVRHMPGGKFTDHVFTAMKEKEILRVEGPYGSFYLREDTAVPVLLAGLAVISWLACRAILKAGGCYVPLDAA